MKLLVFFVCAILGSNAIPSVEYEGTSSKITKSSSAILTKSTQVAALGRVADLGDLYDARSDNFLEISLYTTDLAGDAVHSTDNAYSSIDYVRTETFSEKMNKLDVDAQLGLSVLGDTFKISGSGKYLKEEKHSAKSAKTSLVYTLRTIREDLKIFSKTSRSLIDQFLLENIDATHVVVGVEWGANVVLSLEETNTDSSSARDIQAKLDAALKIASFSISADADVEIGDSDVESSATFSLKLHGDIIPNTVPQTINESISFIRSIPDLIRSENDGKGKIMSYTLMPVATVLKVFQSESNRTGIVKEIDLELIEQFTNIFQEMKDSELQINDVYNDISTWNLMVPESDFLDISAMKGQFDSFTNDLRTKFAEAVIQFRNDELDEEALVALISSYENSNWTSANVITKLNTFKETINKIGLLNLLESSNAYFIDRRTDKYKILTDNYKQEIRVVSIDLTIDISSPYVRDILSLLEAEQGKDNPVRYYIEDNPDTSVPQINAFLQGNVIKTFDVNIKEYIFLGDTRGAVTVIDADTYEQSTSHSLPEIAEAIVAIVKNTFYKIDTLNGRIDSTNIENIMIPPQYINWTQVGSFPAETSKISNSAAVKGSLIYFVTYSGIGYVYDTDARTTTKFGQVVADDDYASLIVVDDVLYIHKYDEFYSFDGNEVKAIATPETRRRPGLFQLEKNVCRVGGNVTDLNPDPVVCYNTVNGTWNEEESNHINEARARPGVASAGRKTYIFGGGKTDSLDEYLDSVEVLNHDTNIWSYVPSPFSHEEAYIQAIAFTF